MPLTSAQKSCNLFRKEVELKTKAASKLIKELDLNDLSDKYFLKLTSNKSVLSSKIDSYETAVSVLSEQDDGAEDSFYNTNFETIMKSLYDSKDTLAELQASVELLEKKKQKSELVVPQQVDNNRFEQNSHSVKLPKLVLPKFDGDILNWKAFLDAFESTIDKNTTLQAVEKFSYLSAQLEGEAKMAIDGLQLTNENYPIALEILKQRFGDEEAVTDMLYSKMRDLPIVNNYTPNIRKLFNSFEKYLRSLQAMGKDIEQDYFVSLLRSKLPNFVNIQLRTAREGTSWTVSDFRKKLGEHIAARESVEILKPETTPNVSTQSNTQRPFFGGRNRFNNQQQSGQQQRTSTAAFMAGNSPGSSSSRLPPFPCFFCKGNHYADKCDMFDTLEVRRAKLQDRCIVCFGTHGKTANCPRKFVVCYHCKKQGHHCSLCPGMLRPEASYLCDGGEGDERNLDVGANQTQGTNPSVTAIPLIDLSESGGPGLLAFGEQVVMQTAHTRFKNSETGKIESTRLLFDCGSSRSYITEEFARKLQLQGKKSGPLFLNTFSEEKAKTIATSSVIVDMVLKNGRVKTLHLNVIPRISGTIRRTVVDRNVLSKCPSSIVSNLADTLPSKANAESTIHILIGNDYYMDVITGQRVEIQNGLYALGSRLGWVLTGRVDSESLGGNLAYFVSEIRVPTDYSPSLSSVEQEVVPKQDLNQFWDLEVIGIRDNPTKSDDEKAMEGFEQSIRFENGRYQVSWPWKEPCPELPTNRELALGRFKSLMKRLERDSGLLSKYNAIIKEQYTKGIVEKVEPHTVESLRKHYIPHHPVVTPLKTTTKVRIVYDASAKFQKCNNSLNECMLRGPVILEDLCGLLIRFRLNPVAIISDIEKAFLQIGLQESERDVTRFFWLKDIEKPLNQENIEIYRFARVPFGVISSPFLLGATVSHHLKKHGSKIAENICDNIYVDNVITGTPNTKEAIGFYKEAKQVFQDASMNLREWCSNSAEFMQSIPETDRDNSPKIKVLGLTWDPKQDTLTVNGSKNPLILTANTKRQVLQSIACVFDPLGFFSPVLLKAKCFMKKLWGENLNWDTKLSNSLQSEWLEIARELFQISNYSLDRVIPVQTVSPLELLCFCDASKHSYATSIYLRNEKGESHLLFSKSRISPKEGLTLPRLELMAVVIGVRALLFVEKHLNLFQVTKRVWTDSLCVLNWIKSTKSLSVFVENRLKEIRKNGEITFAYVQTEHNPADIATRFQSFSDIQDSDMWWHGPSWLKNCVSDWPKWDTKVVSPDILEQLNSEIKRSAPSFYEISNLAGEDPIGESAYMTPLDIDLSRFSSLTKLLRVTAFCIRFVTLLKTKTKTLTSELTADEIATAKLKWEKHIQEKHFTSVFLALKNGENNQLRSQLGLQQDSNGVLRCHGRLTNAEIPYDSKFPKLLPRDSHFTDLVIDSCHRKLFHSGVSHTLSQVRMEYWIPQGRVEVSKVLHRCLVCRKQDGGPFQMPIMPPYPSERVSATLPFTNVGLDYLGPLYVKEGMAHSKIWICLFTCMSVRAVHLELVNEMSAESFLLCLRRFFARRGIPDEITSDNATQFKVTDYAMQKVWKKAVASHEVQTYTASREIKWNFITELAPWMGGFYERLVQNVKRALRKVIGSLSLTYEQLETFVYEAEAIINSRPLTFVGADFDSGHALTPAHFLSARLMCGIPDSSVKTEKTDTPIANNLINTWKKGQNVLKSLWLCWANEYLLSLRERTQTHLKHSRTQVCREPTVGEVVLLKDRTPRGEWKLAKIEERIKGRDGQIRSVRLLLPNKRLLTRPLNLVCPLECTNIATG